MIPTGRCQRVAMNSPLVERQESFFYKRECIIIIKVSTMYPSKKEIEEKAAKLGKVSFGDPELDALLEKVRQMSKKNHTKFRY